MRTSGSIGAFAALAVLLLYTMPAQAQATRSWVSGVGDDVNPCSRTAPCKTFAGAISKTVGGGEISILDPGGFGTVTITKSISIVSEAGEAGLLASGIAGMTISAGPADVVYLQGLTFEGAGKGLSGIRIVSGAAVHIRKSLIRGFRGSPGLGIEIVPTTATQVMVSDSVISNNSGGILVKPTGAGTAQVFLDRVLLENNPGGGIRADGKSATIRLNQLVVTGNGTGLEVAGGGTIISFGNNAIAGNVTNGSPTETLQLK